MGIIVSDKPNSESDISVRLNKQYYAIDTSNSLARWNRDAFQLLYLLFQMTITDIPRSGVPSITIAK